MNHNSNTSIIAGISFTLIGIQVLFDNYDTDQQNMIDLHVEDMLLQVDW